MNGYEDSNLSSGVFGTYSSHTNGHGSHSESPNVKAKSGAKTIYGTDESYFLRSSAKDKKKRSGKQRKNFTKTSINSLTDTSQYHVEHLTSFVLDRKDGMVTVDDGVRRLRLLDAKGKVWTQEVILQVEEKTVSLIDMDTKNELETFPIGTIQHVHSVMNSCNYDSILALVCKESGQNKPDLHLFQCDDIKANLIHADIESAIVDAKGGKVKKRPEALKMILKSDSVIPPPPADPAPEPPAANHRAALPPAANQRGADSQLDVKSRAAAWSAWTHEQHDYDKQRHYSEEAPMEMTAARIDRDVQILNHLLDDIEYLVTKLQKASEAFNELNRRRKAKKGKKKSPGEGVLTLRSKPPSSEEVVDCLQKFKHAFNQLAKLKDHIQNPSAVELLHFLFTPLRMVIHASGSIDLARSILVPLLTREAIDFLHSEGSPEERHLWVTLGDGWTKSRLEWPKEHFFPVCVLRFRDGWEPPSLVAMETDPAHNNVNIYPPAPIGQPEHMHRSYSHEDGLRMEDFRYRLDHQPPMMPPLPPPDGYSGAGASFSHHRQQHSSNMSILDQDVAVATLKHAISRQLDRSFDGDSRTQAKLFAKSKYDFVARNNTELSVMKDEVVEVLDDRKQWWKVRNGMGSAGYVPNNILEMTKAVDITGRGEPIYSHTIQQLLGELNEKQSSPRDFLPGNSSSSSGSGTNNNKATVVPITPPPPPAPRIPTPPPIGPPHASANPSSNASANTSAYQCELAKAVSVSRQNSNTSSENETNSQSGSGRGSVAMRDHKQKPPFNRRKSNMEEVQDELMHRLTLGRSANKKFPSRGTTASMLTASSMLTANISYDSSPEEVKGWLEAKGFSPVTITSLGVLTGAQLFSLNKEELKTVCPDDGARVFSQVTVQKAALERNSSSELQEIMKRRKEKILLNTIDSGVESFDEGSNH